MTTTDTTGISSAPTGSPTTKLGETGTSLTTTPTESDRLKPAPMSAPTIPATPDAPSNQDANVAIPQPAAAPIAANRGTVENPGKPKSFSDVPDDFWAKPAIVALSSRGIISGLDNNTFQPDKQITRAEFAAIIQKGFEKTKVKDAMKFTDIKGGYWAATAIDEATQTGFMMGYPEGVFKPDQSIPRLEMLSAIATGMNLKPNSDPVQILSKYSDGEDMPKWAISKVSSAVEAGLISPNATQLGPNKIATRADAASYIYQALIKEGKIKP